VVSGCEGKNIISVYCIYLSPHLQPVVTVFSPSNGLAFTMTAPDRLARNDVHQRLLSGELVQRGCTVEFLGRPMSQNPHDQLLFQIRGAVAEDEHTLITDRMRRGRPAKVRTGPLLPWSVPLRAT
jgi:DNA invertase Pin-like site-specific DNA recombinase